MNEGLYDIIANQSLQSPSTRLIKKAPASASQTKIGHLNIERTEQPTEKQDKQLTIVSANIYRTSMIGHDLIMSRVIYKNRTLTGMHQRHFQ